MRLVAWNCCERFDRRYLHLRDLDFGVAVVCECGPFDPGLGEAREVTAVLKLAVDQPGHTKHIGVLARDPWRVEALPLAEDQPWLVPVRVTGPLDFTVLAVWALGPEWGEDRLSYPSQTGRVVAQALPDMDGPVVVAGDLNAPMLSSSTSTRLHADNVERLLAGGLMSAFTAARGEVDPLTEPTYYHRWNAAQPFHIDHVFLPKEWIGGVEVSIGTYEEWVATKRSDHVPIVVDLSRARMRQSRGCGVGRSRDPCANIARMTQPEPGFVGIRVWDRSVLVSMDWLLTTKPARALPAQQVEGERAYLCLLGSIGGGGADSTSCRSSEAPRRISAASPCTPDLRQAVESGIRWRCARRSLQTSTASLAACRFDQFRALRQRAEVMSGMTRSNETDAPSSRTTVSSIGSLGLASASDRPGISSSVMSPYC